MLTFLRKNTNLYLLCLASLTQGFMLLNFNLLKLVDHIPSIADGRRVNLPKGVCLHTEPR